MTPSQSRKSLVVTGGAGALGAELCHSLKQRGHEVLALDRRTPSSRVPGVTYRRIDLRDRKELEGLFDGVDVAVHTAALHGFHLASGCDERELFTNNVLSTSNVLSACASAGVRRVVFTSSTSVYGTSADPNGGEASWVDESTPQLWRDLYDATKVIGENLCQWYATQHDADAIALRVTRFFYDDYVSHNVRKLFRGVDLHDAAMAHLLAAENSQVRGFRAYNIAATPPFEPWEKEELFRDAPQVIERHYPGVSKLFSTLGLQLPEKIGRVYDTQKAEEELGYAPRYNFVRFLRELTQKRIVDASENVDSTISPNTVEERDQLL